MNKVFYADWLATADHDDHWVRISTPALVVEQGTVAWVGSRDQLPKKFRSFESKEYEGSGILPGLIDCHTHLVYAGDRSREFVLRQQGQTYSEIQQSGGGIFATVEATRKASFESLFEQSFKRLQAWAKQGVSAIEIKSGYGLDYSTEKKMLEVAKLLSQRSGLTVHKTFLGAHVCAKEFSNNKDYLSYLRDSVLPGLIEADLVDSIDAFCENIAFSSQELLTYFRDIEHYQIPIRLHADQLSETGAVELTKAFKTLSIDHIEYTSEQEIAELKDRGVVAVVLPGAYYYLREKRQPLIECLRQHGIPIAVATDVNPGSSPIHSLPLVMNMACILFNLTVEEAFLGVTIHAAKAINQPQKGKLTPGFDADFAIWDIEDPNQLVASIQNWQCQALYLKGEQYEW